MNHQTIRHRMPRLLAVLAAVAAIGGLSACGGGSVVTRPRLERSLPQAFTNLYVKQAKLLGHQGVTKQSLHARASCDKGGPKVADQGPGADWICLMSWDDPNVPLTDGTGKFEINAHSNACYTAGGPSKLVGLITLTNTRGKDVDNPVFEFDACFDPSGPNTPIPPNGTPAALTMPSGTLAPDDKGQYSPELSCSPGATGGCAGTLTAKIGTKVIATISYQLPPKGANGFPIPLTTTQRKPGTRVTITAAPLIGTAAHPSTTLTVAG
ncbi:MAG: hypothetical protein QOI80_741 [Solirubrobacteraceae bacterium]|nr:hypothetical protein [Solirubrobacteraceae bacterium]